jgi:hypothetical protein
MMLQDTADAVMGIAEKMRRITVKIAITFVVRFMVLSPYVIVLFTVTL